MEREVILANVREFARIEDLNKNHWKKYTDEKLKSRSKIMLDLKENIWIFNHEIEPGLWAKFRENADGTWAYINSWDELKEKHKKNIK